MAINYQTVIEKDFSSGINKLAAEDAVPQSYVENMENMQPNAQGYVEKRKGYQAYAGSLPLRASKAERTEDGLLCLYFDELEGGTAGIDFSTLKPSPVIIYGQSSLTGFESTVSKYYSTFIVDPRVRLGQVTVLPAADVGAKSRDIFVGLGYNAPENEGTKDNEVVYADSIVVDPTTFQVTIGAISNLGNTEVNCFVYVKNHQTVAGESWAGDLTEASADSGVFTIGQLTHQLNTQNYITRYYLPATGEEVFPDSVVVSGSDITASFTSQAKPATIRMVISSIPEIDVETRTVLAKQEVDITFPIDADFAFFEVYSIENGVDSRVLPNSISISGGTATVNVTNNSNNQVKFKIMWERATVRTNKLCVQESVKTITSATSFVVGDKISYNGTDWVLDNTSTTVVATKTGEGPYTYVLTETDNIPQLCLYGLDHTELYPDSPDRAGWVSHIDSYKSEGENYLVAGLGWNLYKAVYHSSLPTRQPLLRVTVKSLVKTGPMFNSASTPTNFVRDRISYSFTGGNEGWANVLSVEFQEDTGFTKLILSTPNKVKHTNNGGDPVDYRHDKLTVFGTSQKIHRGEWPIFGFEDPVDSDTLVFYIYNPNVTTSDYDEDLVGEAGVFTDKVEFTDPGDKTYSLVVGDGLEGAAFPQGLSGSLSCVSTVGSVSYFNGVGETIEFPEGQVYTVRRTGRMLRVRDISAPNTNPYEQFVPEDVIALSDRERRYRIVNIVANSVTGISVSVDGTVGEATVTNVDSSPYKVGQWLTLASAGRFSGEYEIKDLPDTSTIILDSSNVKDNTTSVLQGAYIQGRMFELNYEDEFYDDPNSLLSITVPLRWFPLENPTGSPRRVKHLETNPYTKQNFVRSVMAQDNMYFANYSDHLLKYDGVSLFRSGLVRWQPGLFVTGDTDNPAKIIVPAQVTAKPTTTTGSFVLNFSGEETFTLFNTGDRLDITGSSLNPFTIVAIDNTNTKITLNKAVDITGLTNAAVTVSQHNPNIYRYYFRLTAYDANDNVVTSATTGSNEFIVSLPKSGAIRLRLIGLPKFEQLNYSRVFLEVYRTRRNTVAPFYNVFKNTITFDYSQPYIDITDTISDEALPAQPDDAVLTFLAGASLGNGLSQPPQAKYCTVADNRLALANISDDPKIQIDVFGNPELTEFNGKTFHLRKDNTSTTNDLTFEMTTTSHALTSTTINLTLNPPSLTATLVNGVSFTTGEWIYAFHSASIEAGLFNGCGWFKVNGSGTIQLPFQKAPAQEIFTVAEGTEVVAGANFVVGDKLELTLVSGSYKYTKKTNQAEPGADYFEVTAKNGTTYTLQHYSFFGSKTALENTDTGNNPTGFVLGAYLTYNASTAKYEVATTQAEGINNYRIVKIVTGTNDTYTLTHYHKPDRVVLTVGKNDKDFPVYMGTDYNYGWNNANNSNIYSAASRALLRLSNAINFSQSVSTSPWVFANAGLDLGGQTMVLAFPENSLTTTPEIVFPSPLGNVEYYGNKIKVKTAGENVGAVTSRFPSRLVISYPNFAEVFHRPFDDSGALSESIIDVNPADGQEITGVFPFFSESAFGASLKSASLIVFKTNSIYIVNPDTRQSQKIETNGLGCTAPYSIAATREGLMFANEAGLYRLTRALTVEPIGSYIDRLWREGVNHSALDLMQGHAYGVGRRYKVSIPVTDQTTPSDVLVYDYTREDSRNTYGSWTKYSNHPATGWCNLLEDAYFGSTRGRVYKVSNANSKYDYQDDGSAITGSVVFRALDFGDSAIRKRVLHLLVHYRIPSLSEGQVDIETAKVYMGINLVDNFVELDKFKIDVPNEPDGLSTISPNKQVTLRYSVRNPKSLYFQVKVDDNGLHTPLQVTGLSFRVAGLSTEGITEAAQTTKE